MHSTIHAVCGQQKGQNIAKSHVWLILKKKKKKFFFFFFFFSIAILGSRYDTRIAVAIRYTYRRPKYRDASMHRCIVTTLTVGLPFVMSFKRGLPATDTRKKTPLKRLIYEQYYRCEYTQEWPCIVSLVTLHANCILYDKNMYCHVDMQMSIDIWSANCNTADLNTVMASQSLAWCRHPRGIGHPSVTRAARKCSAMGRRIGPSSDQTSPNRH